MTERTKKLIDLRCQQVLADNTDVIHENDFMWGFAVGVNAVQKVIWHDSKSKPTRRGELIVISDGTSIMMNNRFEKMEKNHMWAYLRDLLPEIPSPVKPLGKDEMEDDSTKIRDYSAI